VLKGDLEAVFDEARQYLNTFVAPHNLISFSVFEDDHPCPNHFYHVVVMHRGDGLTPIKRNEEIRGDIYQLKTEYSKGEESWEHVIQKVCGELDS
jgi:hypothetical protein